MRVTAIPAQITTVEDHITGNLSLIQLILLCVPVFTGGLLYAALPPVMRIVPYKLPIIVIVTVVCGLMTIRIKGQIALSWIGILLRYWLRPRYYVFDKHSMRGREQYRKVNEVVEAKTEKAPDSLRKQSSLSLEDLARLQELIENPAANLAFETRKGGLYVRLTEIKQEN